MKTEKRKNLFYKRYLYRAQFNFPNARWVRYASRIEHFNVLYEKQNKTVDASEKAKNFMEYYHNKGDTICRIEHNNVSIFSNDLKKLKELCSKVIDKVEFTKALVYDCIVLNNRPKHNNRVYFKQKWLSKNDLEKIKEFLDLNVRDKTDIKINKSLERIIYSTAFQVGFHTYFHGHHHIDFNEDSFLTILHLWLDQYIGKSYKLVWVYEKDKYSNTVEYLDGKDN